MKRISTLFLACLLGCSLFAQPLGWNFTNVISVTENSGANVYNYQLMINFDSQTLINAGQMNADGSDLRFGTYCDSTNLNYWIESGINTPNTVVWVKLDSLLANQSRNIFMFYGNLAATSVSAVNGTFLGPNSATDSVASGAPGGVANSQRGFRFSPNQDLLVTSFGKREPTGTNRYITLFDFGTQAILQQIQVGGPAAQYSYAGLTNPIWLTQGTQYVLELYQDAGDGYYFGTSNQIGQHLTYYDMRYCNSCTQNTFPTSTLSNYHYGYPDLWYYTKSNVSPAPTYSLGAPLNISLGPDTAFCVSGILDAGNAGSTFAWNTLETSQTINVSITGTYGVTVTTPQNCVVSDSINVVVNPNPIIDFGNDTSYCNGTILDAGVGYTYLWNDNSTAQTLPVTLTGTYSVEIVDSNDCSASDTVGITINGLPVVSGSATPSTLCAGDTVDFQGSGALTYSWDNGIINGLNAVNTGGNFIVTGTDVNNCTNTDTVVVTVNSLPIVSFSFGTDSVCTSYGSITLSGGSPAGGSYSGTGVSGGNFDPAVGVGNYALSYTYTDGNGCTNVDTDNILVSGCAGIEDTELKNVHIFPNPTSGSLNIYMDEITGNTIVTLYDMLGKNVYNTMLSSTHSLIQLNVIPGMYILEVANGNKTMREQIIVQ